MGGEAIGQFELPGEKILEFGQRDACGRLVLERFGAAFEAFPDPAHQVGREGVGLARGGGLQLFFQLLFFVLIDAVGFGLRHAAHVDQPLDVILENSLLRLDLLVHRWLGELGLVAFVMAAQAVAVHVNHDIALELLPELHREANGLGDGFGVFAIHVEDRNLQHLADVGRVGAGPGVFRIGREADLVVDDDVDGSARGVALQLAHVERFLDDAFPGERGISMNENHQALEWFTGGDAVDLGPHAAQGDGVDELEMAGVHTERDVNLLLCLGDPLRVVSEVVLDVAPAHVGLGVEVFELAENLARLLAGDIGEDV